MQKVVAVSLDSRCSNAFLSSSAMIPSKVHASVDTHALILASMEEKESCRNTGEFVSNFKRHHCTAIGVVYIQVAAPLSWLQKHWRVLNPTSNAATLMWSTSSIYLGSSASILIAATWWTAWTPRRYCRRLEHRGDTITSPFLNNESHAGSSWGGMIDHRVLG